jgi:hypothetical protein
MPPGDCSASKSLVEITIERATKCPRQGKAARKAACFRGCSQGCRAARAGPFPGESRRALGRWRRDRPAYNRQPIELKFTRQKEQILTEASRGFSVAAGLRGLVFGAGPAKTNRMPDQRISGPPLPRVARFLVQADYLRGDRCDFGFTVINSCPFSFLKRVRK